MVKLPDGQSLLTATQVELDSTLKRRKGDPR